VGARIVGRLFLSQRRTAVSATTLTVAETSTSAGPPALGAFGEMSTEWTGRLSLNGACAPVRAAVTEAAHNPYAYFGETSISRTLKSVQKTIGLARGFAT
jgi:hypothetical protein